MPKKYLSEKRKYTEQKFKEGEALTGAKLTPYFYILAFDRV